MSEITNVFCSNLVPFGCTRKNTFYSGYLNMKVLKLVAAGVGTMIAFTPNFCPSIYLKAMKTGTTLVIHNTNPGSKRYMYPLRFSSQIRQDRSPYLGNVFEPGTITFHTPNWVPYKESFNPKERFVHSTTTSVWQDVLQQAKKDKVKIYISYPKFRYIPGFTELYEATFEEIEVLV
jgi:hypothetical protein